MPAARTEALLSPGEGRSWAGPPPHRALASTDPGAPLPLCPMDDPEAFRRVPWAVVSHFSPWWAEVANEEENQCFRDRRQLHLVLHGDVTGQGRVRNVISRGIFFTLVGSIRTALGVTVGNDPLNLRTQP